MDKQKIIDEWSNKTGDWEHDNENLLVLIDMVIEALKDSPPNP